MDTKDFYLKNDEMKIHCKLDYPISMISEADRCPLVVLVHGFTGHMEEDHIIAVKDEMLDNGFAVLRTEMYGHGKSDGKFRDHTLIKWVDQMMCVIDYAADLSFVTDLFLAGHSQGGLLTVLMGALEHDRLKAIIPLSPAVSIPDDANKGRNLGAEYDPMQIPGEVRRTVPDEMLEEAADTFVLGGNYLRIAQLIPVDECIKRYDGPVLIIHGDADDVIPIEYAIDAQKKYRNCTLETIRDADHCYVGHLDEVRSAIRRFLLQFKQDKISLQGS